MNPLPTVTGGSQAEHKALQRLRAQHPGNKDRSFEDAVLLQLNRPGKEPMQLRTKDLSDHARRELGKLLEASEKFEALQVAQMFRSMQSTLAQGMGGGAMGDMAVDMFTRGVADMVAERGNGGAGQALFNQTSEALLRRELGRVQTNDRKQP